MTVKAMCVCCHASSWTIRYNSDRLQAAPACPSKVESGVGGGVRNALAGRVLISDHVLDWTEEDRQGAPMGKLCASHHRAVLCGMHTQIH